jgi:hypothetical protein
MIRKVVDNPHPGAALAASPAGRWAWVAALGLVLAGGLLFPGAPRAQERSCEAELDQLAARLDQAERRADAARASLAAEQSRARTLPTAAMGAAPGTNGGLPPRVMQRLRPALEATGAELLAAECDAQPCVVAIRFPRVQASALTPRLVRMRSALGVDDRHDQVVGIGGVVLLVSPVGPGATPGEDAARLARLLAEVAEEVR